MTSNSKNNFKKQLNVLILILILWMAGLLFFGNGANAQTSLSDTFNQSNYEIYNISTPKQTTLYAPIPFATEFVQDYYNGVGIDYNYDGANNVVDVLAVSTNYGFVVQDDPLSFDNVTITECYSSQCFLEYDSYVYINGEQIMPDFGFLEKTLFDESSIDLQEYQSFNLMFVEGQTVYRIHYLKVH